MKNQLVFTGKQAARKTKDENIRSVLKNTLIQELHNQSNNTDNKARLFSEFGVDHGSFRIDVITVSGDLHGYEIKSDADTLERLPEQVEAYSRVFNRVTLVVGVSHIFDALFIIPDWWGVKLAKGCADGSVALSDIRIAQDNPSQDMMSLARLLWKQEVLEILESMGASSGVKSKCRELVYKRFISVADDDVVQKTVIDKLFNRVDWRVDQPLLQYGG